MFKNPNNPQRKPPNEKFFSDMNGIKFEKELILEWADEKQCKICLQEIKTSPFGNFNGSLNPINNIILYECKLVLTEYRLILIPKIPEISFDIYKEDYFTVPIFNISKVEKLIDKNNLSNFKIEIQTSDFRDLKISLPLEKNSIYETLIDITNPKESNSFYQFAMKYKSILDINEGKNEKNQINGYEIYNIEKEFLRQKINTIPELKLLEINKDFKLCSTYPEKTYHMITEKITEDDIIKAASYRTKNRYPTLSYYYNKSSGSIWRSSQNKAGIINSRNNYDEKVLESIAQLSKINVKNKLIIFDARPFLSAYANKLKGAGFENIDNYPGAEIHFCQIENIHTARNALNKIYSLLKNPKFSENNKFYSNFENTGWIDFIFMLIKGSIQIAQSVKNGNTVLIHCSDGWDRASQLTAFSQFLIDPFYKTILGYMTLIEKDFLSFGHQFRARNGYYSKTEYNENQNSPILLQFLDATHQFLVQYPMYFEFNMDFLIFIGNNINSGLYGTFLYNNEKERETKNAKIKTMSCWTEILNNITQYKNPFYEIKTRKEYFFTPMFAINRIRLWEEYFLPFTQINVNNSYDNYVNRFTSSNFYYNIFGQMKQKNRIISNIMFIDREKENYEKNIDKLKKENQQLKMENDILKQAALILGQKSK
jgi:myotubularin-related protein 1/2